MNRTSFSYVLKELSQIFLIGLMVFMIIVLMDKVFRLIELIVTKGASLLHILRLMMYITPSFLVFTVPMALLLGTLLTFGRLSSDNEITAFKASGVSLYQLFRPVFLFSIAASLFTTWLVFYGLPWGNRGFMATLQTIVQAKADVQIQERVFNDEFEGLVVYVDKVPIEGQKLEGVLIYDERDQERFNTIFAKEAFLFNDPRTRDLVLKLVKGEIHRTEQKTHTYHRIQFDAYDLKLELSKTFAAIGRKLRDHEMSIEEIEAKIEKMRQEGKNPAPLQVELHKRYALPLACVVFGLIGVPLGIQPRRSGRSHGFIFSILILLGYYVSLSACEILAVRGAIPAFMAGWAPTFVFAGLGTYLLVKAANDSPFKPLVWLSEGLDRLQHKWKELVDRD
jgi:lipopolysaccharide export system permease protein